MTEKYKWNCTKTFDNNQKSITTKKRKRNIDKNLIRLRQTFPLSSVLLLEFCGAAKQQKRKFISRVRYLIVNLFRLTNENERTDSSSWTVGVSCCTNVSIDINSHTQNDNEMNENEFAPSRFESFRLFLFSGKRENNRILSRTILIRSSLKLNESNRNGRTAPNRLKLCFAHNESSTFIIL